MILDSNIIIGYLNGDESIRVTLHAWRESGRVFFVSHVSVIEALSLPTLTPEQIGNVKNFLDDFVIIQLDMEVSVTAVTSTYWQPPVLDSHWTMAPGCRAKQAFTSSSRAVSPFRFRVC